MDICHCNNIERVGNPRYILDVLLGVIGISVKSVEIAKALSKVKFEEREGER